MFIVVDVLIALLAVTAGYIVVTYVVFSEGPVRIRPVLTEVLSAWVTLVLYPLGYLDVDRFLPLPADPPGTGKATPVILIHGFLMNRACMFLLLWRLRRKGYAAYTVLLWPIYASIERLARAVSSRIEQIGSLPGEKIVLIGHSMGGLVARYYCERMGGHASVSSIITIATPHSGTKAARFGWWPNAREMRPTSSFLRSLAASRRGDLRYAFLWSPSDNIINPTESARGPDGEGIRTEPLGHLSLLYSPRVFSTLEKMISHP